MEEPLGEDFVEGDDSGIDSDNERRNRLLIDFFGMKSSSECSPENTKARIHSPSPDPDDGRESPPLLEVELTASDEDDDGSVLELVIPMQNKSKYQDRKNDCGCMFFRMIICCIPFGE